MTSTPPFGASDADIASLAGLMSRLQTAHANRNSAEAAEIRELAAAGALARQQTRSLPAKAHEMALRSIAAEIAVLWRMSPRSVLARIGRAMTLVDHYPETFAAFEAGRITPQHVSVVMDCGTPLDVETRQEFDTAAVAHCERDTAGRVKPVLERIAGRLRPGSPTERHREACELRSARLVPLDDSVGRLEVTDSIVKLQAIMDRSTEQARTVIDVCTQATTDAAAAASVAGGDDPTTAEIIASDRRTLDQVRVDLIVDMLLTACPQNDPTVTGDGPGALGAIRGVVQVTVPVLTLLGDDSRSADLAGHGPIDGETARALAGDRPGLDRILTHPVTGAVLATDRYRPTAELRRFLRGRDQRCRFPGCRMPAVRSDEDHTRDFALDGATEADNLAHLCRAHHTMKHATPWRVRQLSGGVLEWTSPTGLVVVDHPPGAEVAGSNAESLGVPPPKHEPRPVVFTADGDPPPF